MGLHCVSLWRFEMLYGTLGVSHVLFPRRGGKDVLAWWEVEWLTGCAWLSCSFPITQRLVAVEHSRAKIAASEGNLALYGRTRLIYLAPVD